MINYIKITLFILFILLISSAIAQPDRPTISEVSKNLNKELPQVYDHATKLMTTTVENNNFIYHFTLRATEIEYKMALPKVKSQILSTICSKKRERSLFEDHKVGLVYRYESERGTTLGEFLVRPEHCER